MLACGGELFPRETRDSWMRSLVLYRLYFHCSFLPSLLSLQFIIRRQSSISLPSVIFKLALPSLILEDNLFWLLWGMCAQSDMNLPCCSSSSHTPVRLGGFGISFRRYNAWCSPFWIPFWMNNISLPSFYLHTWKYIVGVTVVITATNNISSKNWNWFTF